MRFPIRLPLLACALLLAGCLADRLPAPGPAEGTRTLPAAPAAVDLEQTLDLREGAAGKAWEFQVAPGAREAEVTVVFQGPDGAPAHGPLTACVRYSAQEGGSTVQQTGGNCSSGGVEVSVGVSDLARPQTLLHLQGGEVAVGASVLTLDARPTVGEAVVSIHIHY